MKPCKASSHIWLLHDTHPWLLCFKIWIGACCWMPHSLASFRPAFDAPFMAAPLFVSVCFAANPPLPAFARHHLPKSCGCGLCGCLAFRAFLRLSFAGTIIARLRGFSAILFGCEDQLGPKLSCGSGLQNPEYASTGSTVCNIHHSIP